MLKDRISDEKISSFFHNCIEIATAKMERIVDACDDEGRNLTSHEMQLILTLNNEIEFWKNHLYKDS